MKTRIGIEFRLWARITAVAVSALALAIIFKRLDLPSLYRALKGARLGWLVATNALFALVLLFASMRWHLMLRLNKSSVHSGATLRMTFIGHFFSTLLFGPAGGDVAKAFLYSRWYGYPAASVLATCALDRLLGGAALLVLSGAAPLLSATSRKSFNADFYALAPKAGIVGGIAVAVVVVSLVLRRLLRKTSPAVRFLNAFRANLRQLLTSPKLASRGLLLSILAEAAVSGLLLLSLLAVTQTSIPILDALWTFPAIILLTALPITFAGTGIREGAALSLLGFYGIKPTDAVAAALLVSLILLFWALLGSVVLWRSSRARSAQPSRNQPRTISAILPTLNEVAWLEDTVRRLHLIPEIAEIIVVDGGSTDGTKDLADRLGCRTLVSARGRGLQMRSGATAAGGDVILLVHADTWLPPEAGRAVIDCLRDPTIVAGGFWKSFRQPHPLMLGSRFRCAVRLYLAGRVMGDQTMFIRREVLESVGGVPAMPLMEEFELCRRLRTVGHLALAGATVLTSTRRFAQGGIARTYLRMWGVTLRYYFGTPAHKLQRIYEKE